VRDQRQTICVFKEKIGRVVGLIGKRNGEENMGEINADVLS
jgi:hypothetical protein